MILDSSLLFGPPCIAGLKIRKIFNCTQIERRRREGRSAEGPEEDGVWGEGVPSPSD